MRRACLFLFLLPLLASADTIFLKSGRKIYADNVREINGKVEYTIGDDTYRIPKSLVDKIESGGSGAASPASSAAAAATPAFSSGETVKGADEALAKIVKDGRVDPDGLASLEKTGNRELAAAGYFIAGRFEYEHGNRDQARTYLERSLSFLPDNPVILSNYAAVLVQMGRAREALDYAERASRLAPNSADALAVLGYAYFAADRSKDALAAWKKSLALRPDAGIQALVDKAGRELTAEATFSQSESAHFTLRCEGSKTTEALGRQVLDTLESHYNDLVRDLGIAPRNSIPVILYTDQAFFDVTQAPSWTGALNDGKLRIPIQGVTSVNSELSRVLKHELAHSFINQVSRGRCPQWLHEGIAQMMEPKRSAQYGRQLAQLYAQQRQIPLNALESSFMGFNTGQAVLAYAEALAAAEYVRDTYGVSDLVRILERIGEGSSTENAMRATIHSGYREMEDEMGKYLKDKYGE